MRIRRIKASAFRCIETADVELGRGLNVLYGPNDHGKSTLALALRAALLLPPGATEAAGYASWFDGQSPSVEVVFDDDEDKVWRVSKTFGSGAKAEPDFSKDGITFTRDCTARQVEEKLRNLLQWGIATPGGKGSPRGFPTSFLSQVLLAEQTDVIALLDSDLADDANESGRDRLTKALKGLAQDPLFKRVLEKAQAECDLYFTATGQKKRGKSSPLAEAAERLNRIRQRLEDTDKRLQESQAAESDARRLGDLQLELLDARETHVARVAEARKAYDRQRRLDLAKQQAEEARAIVARMRENRARMDTKIAEMAQLAEVVIAQEVESKRLTASHAEAVEAMRQADEAYRLATSKNAARERELLQAQLENQRAELALSTQQARDRREAAILAQAAQKALKEAEQLHRKAAKHLTAMTAAVRKCSEDRALQQQRLEWADDVVAFARFRAAAIAAESSRLRREEAAKLRKEAARLKVEAADKIAAAESASLPGSDELNTMLDLQRQLDLAEAALGGGLSMVVEPRRRIAIQTRVDDVQGSRVLSSDPLEIEAARLIEMSIDNVLDMRIVAGDANSRRQAEHLRAECTQKIVPVLALAKMLTLTEVQQAVEARAAALAQAGKMVEEARGLEARAVVADSMAVESEILGKEAPVREQALAGRDRAALRREFERLGSTDAAEQTQQASRRAVDEANKGVGTAEKEVATAGADLRNAAERLRRAGGELDAKLAPLKGEDPSSVVTTASRTLDELEAKSKAVETELRGILEQRDSKAARAGKLQIEAAEHLKAALEVQEVAQDLLAQSKNASARAEGELAVLHEVSAKDDLPAADAALKTRDKEVAAVIGSGPIASAEDVANAERAQSDHDAKLAEIQRQTNQAEGALMQVGGATVKDEIADLNRLRDNAEASERDLTIEAEAWQLLRDTLREAEDTEGAHLGRALSAPVSERFADLTGKRYDAFSIGPALATEGVSLNGATARPTFCSRRSRREPKSN